MTGLPRALPQLGGDLFLTDGGLETSLIYLDGIDLPDFASFTQLGRPDGEAALHDYFRGYVEVASRYGVGLILESATWRASADWGARLGYSPDALAAANHRGVRLLAEIRDEAGPDAPPIVLSGCLGPRGDGYVPGHVMDEAEAERYHAGQVTTFAAAGADMVSAITMNYAEEAIGIARAARAAAMPVAIAFTVETDGRLPIGQSLGAAIERVDAATRGYPAYYMVNCAHPTHFERELQPGPAWVERVRGIRANASCRSHAELNEAVELDEGDPDELADQYARIRARLPWINVMGGCCGTDVRHIEAIARACAPLFAAAV